MFARITRETCLAGATILALAPVALAARPDTRAYTCDQGRSLIAQSGAIVMTTGPNTYERIVHNRGFCSPDQEQVTEIVPASDDPRCRIGYTCRDKTVNK